MASAPTRNTLFQTGHILHGGDYNPEQWLDRPDILDEDIRLFKEAGINVVSMGIFSWSMLEPAEGDYQLDWLGDIIDRLYENGISTVLATPSGSRPKWLADRYPEVLREDEHHQKMRYGGRHNHCLTSPVYREKVAAINRELSARFGHHKGVILWHISNEYGGECHCPLCEDAFREWLKKRYNHDIEEVNRRWYTTFWSHRYDSFDQIEAPSAIGEMALHGLNLDWKRFVTDQTADFLRAEIEAVRAHSSLPVTTNFMYEYAPLNYFRLAKELDVVSMDTYPVWGKEPFSETALDNGMYHDLMRSILDRPHLQMESCPSSTNWQSVSKLKPTGLLTAQSLQAVAHGADAAMYFQMRQSRGSSEKFHGAVIDHYGKEDTRVFQEVKRISGLLEKLDPLCGSRIESSAAILYDWENRWAMEDAQGPRNKGLHQKDLIMNFYRALRRYGLNVDLKDMDSPLTGYRIVIAPMLYMYREGFAEKLKQFVQDGGILISTYWNGVVDENDRCWLGETPHGLTEVLGLRFGEIDGLYDWEENILEPVREGMPSYRCHYLCELPKLLGARPVYLYGSSFYAGTPAVTVNTYGKGKAWYVGTCAEEAFYLDLIGRILEEEKIKKPAAARLPKGVEVTERLTENRRFQIWQNFSDGEAAVQLPEGLLGVLIGDPEKPIPQFGTVIMELEKD